MVLDGEADVCPEGAFHDRGHRLDDHDVMSGCSQGCGDLATDEPSADHSDGQPGLQPLSQRESVVDGSDDEASILSTCQWEASRSQTGSDHESVVTEQLAVGELDGPVRDVGRHGRNPKDPLDV